MGPLFRRFTSRSNKFSSHLKARIELRDPEKNFVDNKHWYISLTHLIVMYVNSKIVSIHVPEVEFGPETQINASL